MIMVLKIFLYGNSVNESSLVITNNFIANVAYKLCTQFKFMSIFIALTMMKERNHTGLAISLVGTTLLCIIYMHQLMLRSGG